MKSKTTVIHIHILRKPLLKICWTALTLHKNSVVLIIIKTLLKIGLVIVKITWIFVIDTLYNIDMKS